MRPRLCFPIAGAALVAALLVAPSRALAYDVLAVPCSDAPYTCGIAPVTFDKQFELPITWDFDTGGVPSNSPLQVRIFSHLWAETYVSLAGSLETSWPKAFALRAPGKPEGGKFGFHYGADFGAEAKIDINVAGYHITWQGDVPFIPQFDVQVKNDKVFNAWGFPPGVTLSSTTAPQQLASVSIGDLIGSPIPGAVLDAGFELDVAFELEATYTTKRIVVQTTDGAEVPGGAILSEDGDTFTPYLSGPSIELDVHPEGTVNYDGILHLIPAFYVSILGNDWQIPIVDIPIAFPITDQDWIFDPQRVHVPLPDLAIPTTEIDFGEVEVGQKSLVPFTLWNAGEAQVVAKLVSSSPVVFQTYDTDLSVDPSATIDSAVRFAPTQAGDFSAQILVTSNDPSHPLQVVTVRGKARGPLILAQGIEDDDDFDYSPDLSQQGSCACRAAGSPSSPARPALALFAAAILGAAARRRRR
jgi:MYXO-CTERM domain-containing protein